MAREFKIFISHCWDYHTDLVKLRSLLLRRGYFNVEFLEASIDMPINSERAVYVKRALRSKIITSHLVLAIGGMYASYSEWMYYELETAYQRYIPVVGVAPFGQQRVSKIVQDYSIQVVRWNTESIVNAIRTYAKV
ncbi:TIR domain-containing protein [Pararcticibacter amylolyticus]|uniref:Thoeris protein ThsB TIR-like domain-containing protein n=1 Tax=Pararcticibacter amylolyticus TaxID=2173175 RepID=A0A2U2PIT8_9SPHI|nr:hypothetical protein DDR33_07280 [Pararcticibacter amylolyticus]